MFGLKYLRGSSIIFWFCLRRSWRGGGILERRGWEKSGDSLLSVFSISLGYFGFFLRKEIFFF